ncbi:MAG: hypothetical protein JJU36_00250 [Phycisphaeraceae bacterium]|nr:hypothetical protein [Phycisphaeraceae bacterium]
MNKLISLAAVLLCAWIVAPASGQQATFAPAAVQPSADVWQFRQLVGYTRLKDRSADDPATIDRWETRSIISYGLTGDLALVASIPSVVRVSRDDLSGDRDTVGGIEDITILGQWRFWQDDSGATDTTRLALLFGAEVPTFITPLSSESVDPIVGIAATHITGRHSFNGGVRYKLNTGGPDKRMMAGDGGHDALFADVNYLYRIAPAAYGPDTTAATYLVSEFSFVYETNGDTEGRLGLGILYEARTWAAEVAVQFPVWRDLRYRPEPGVSIVVGIRFLF